jgi:hypothetical protein
LAEDLGGDLEGAEGVSILEEALRVESVAADHFTELLHDATDKLALLVDSLASAIDGGGADLANWLVDFLLETLGGEDLIDLVGEVSPAHMLAFLLRLVLLAEHLELALRDRALRHGEADAELSCRDVARAQTVEVAEELCNAYALLRALGANASDHVIAVVGGVADDLSLAGASLSLGVVVETVVEALVDTEELITAVNIFAEVDIVDLIDVTLVHIAAQEALEHLLGRIDAEQV